MTDAANRDLGRLTINIFAFLLVLTYAIPYVYLVSTALKPAADVQQIPPSFFPSRLTLENFQSVLATPSLPKAFRNSLVVATLTTLLSLVLAVPAAYVATQYRRRITVVFLLFALITRMVPAVSLGVPLFMLLK